MTLTEFLLARIAEDEARARPMWELKVRQRIVDAPIVPLSWPTPDRVLAECEAKRRIVELRESAQYQVSKAGDDPTDAFALTFRSQVIAFDAALATLALPYADHPDFREEWKP